MGIITRNFANNVLSSGTLDATDGIDGVIPSSNIANASVTNITELPPAIEVIESVATDPVSPDEGEVWYNSTDNVLKVQSATTVGTWAAGGNLNTGRRVMGAAGTQTSALAFGGTTPPDAIVDATEKYNGTTWTSNPTGLGTARIGLAGAGTQTATLGFGGRTLPGVVANTESFNGSTFSPVNSMNTARSGLGGTGTQTAALGFGGSNHTPAQSGGEGLQTATELWNGTSWTSNPTGLNTARNNIASATAGTQTAALGFGGYVAPPITWSSATESWNGSTWTTVNSLNTGRRNLSGAGTQTSALAFAGLSSGDTPSGATELWNGTSWTTNPNSMATARHSIGGTGTQTAALAIGGGPTGVSTEEFTGPGAAVTQTITVS
jgi:hypothetical protein